MSASTLASYRINIYLYCDLQVGAVEQIGNNVYRIVFLPVHKNGTALRALRRSRDAGVVKKEKGRRRLVRDRSSNFLVSAPSIGSHDPPFFIYIDFPFLSPCHSFLLFCLLLELLLLFDRDNFKAKPRPNPINSKSKPKEKNDRVKKEWKSTEGTRAAVAKRQFR